MTAADVRYSYRADPAVPRFDDSEALIIFDGHCVLCFSGVQWMFERDPKGTSPSNPQHSPQIVRTL